MMYQTIYKALVEAELDGQYEPQDYLNFFCLGTREASDETVSKYSSRNQPKKIAKPNAAQVYIYIYKYILCVCFDDSCFFLLKFGAKIVDDSC